MWITHTETENNTLLNNRLVDNARGAIRHTEALTNNLIIYNNSFGEILWFGNSNLTISNDLDFGSNLEITNNNIYFNTSAGSNYNRSANLSLYGINITSLNIDNPKPQRNGFGCGSGEKG